MSKSLFKRQRPPTPQRRTEKGSVGGDLLCQEKGSALLESDDQLEQISATEGLLPPIGPQGGAFLPEVLLIAPAGPLPWMLHPSDPGWVPGHQRMRKNLPSGSLLNEEPAATMSQPHTISQWQPSQPWHFHRSRRQTPCGPQGMQPESRREGSLSMVPISHTIATDPRLQNSS